MFSPRTVKAGWLLNIFSPHQVPGWGVFVFEPPRLGGGVISLTLAVVGRDVRGARATAWYFVSIAVFFVPYDETRAGDEHVQIINGI